MHAIKRFCLLACAGFVFARIGRAADGNELAAIGAIQKGTGGAGVAAPKDATWALLNPASMVDLDRRVDFSFEMLLNEIQANAHGFPLLANPSATDLTDYNAIPIPSFAMIWRTSENDALGAGILGVEGNKLEFRKSRATLALLQHEDRRSAYEVARIPLSYAHRFDNGWSVGGSLLVDYTRFKTDSLTLRLMPTQGDFEWDLAFGVGYQLALYKNWDTFAVGIDYTSRQAMQPYKKYKDLILWNLDFPQKVQAGIAWRPMDHLEFVADYKWINWAALNQLAEKSIRGGAGWRDQNIVKAGITWDPDGPWTFRVGTSYGNSAVPDEAVFVNLITPAIAEFHLGAGFSYAFNDQRSIHFSYLRAFENTSEDNGKGDIFSRLGKGSNVTYSEDSFTVEYSWKF